MAAQPRDRVDAKRRRVQAKIAKALREIDFALPGSVAVRNYRCGKDNCACHADPPRLHGPSGPVDAQDRREDREPRPQRRAVG